MLGKKGFTLVEILITAIILGILASIVTLVLLGRRESAYGAEGVMALGSIRRAERLYYSINGRYTDSLDNLDVKASDLGGRFYGGDETRIQIIFPGGNNQRFIAQIQGIPGREAKDEWVEIDELGFIRASYSGDTPQIPE